MDLKDSPWPKLRGNHHFPPYNILCAWPWDQHPKVILSQDSKVGVPKFPKLGLSQFWGPIILCVDLWLRWGLKQNYSPHQEISNDMLHTTFTQGNRSDSRLLVVRSQIINLTPGLSFGHNLCFKFPNGSHEPIIDIYVPRAFQWYKKILNPMGFDSYNYFLKIWESIRTPTPKMGAHLGVWGLIPPHSPTFMGAWDMTPKLPFWPSPLQALALVASPRLGLRHQWKRMVDQWIVGTKSMKGMKGLLLKKRLITHHKVHKASKNLLLT
jgi:hypothetical protein